MKCVSPEKGFLGLKPEQAVDYKSAKAVIVPFGLERSVSYGRGTHQGPQAIIQASHEVELFDEGSWSEPFKIIQPITLEKIKINEDIPKALSQLEAVVEKILADGKFPFVFGGEHSITAGSIRPFAKKYDNLIMLHFDAHADLRDGYQGEHYSHASAIRRCLDYINIEVVSLGICNISAEEVSFLEANRHRIHIYWAKDKKQWDRQQLFSLFKDRPIYLTFDLDGFDASLMPATGTPEPGGLFWDEVQEIIEEVTKIGTIVGADINELAPIPGLHSCDFLAAKLAYRILAYAIR